MTRRAPTGLVSRVLGLPAHSLAWSEDWTPTDPDGLAHPWRSLCSASRADETPEGVSAAGPRGRVHSSDHVPQSVTPEGRGRGGKATPRPIAVLGAGGAGRHRAAARDPLGSASRRDAEHRRSRLDRRRRHAAGRSSRRVALARWSPGERFERARLRRPITECLHPPRRSPRICSTSIRSRSSRPGARRSPPCFLLHPFSCLLPSSILLAHSWGSTSTRPGASTSTTRPPVPGIVVPLSARRPPRLGAPARDQ
jgi:hypothetical protein